MILIIIIMHHNHHWIIIIINIIIIIINHNHPHAHPHPHYIMAVSRLQHHLMRLSDQDLPGLEHQMWESCNAIMAASWTPCELVFLWLVSFHPCSHLRYQQKKGKIGQQWHVPWKLWSIYVHINRQQGGRPKSWRAFLGSNSGRRAKALTLTHRYNSGWGR